MEYGCAVAGAKLILVMGHTRCGAVTAAVDLVGSARTAAEATGCQHLDHIVDDIQQIDRPADAAGASRSCRRPRRRRSSTPWPAATCRGSVETMRQQSQTLDGLVREGRIAIVGAMYDVATGDIEFLPAAGLSPARILDPV